jgi:hypothetical protein
MNSQTDRAVSEIDIERLFQLRAAVGRFGEMDGAGWWNTQGVLGARGAAVYNRGLPRTGLLARVRVVTVVAAERSRTVYPAPGVHTLWNLPPALERSLSFHQRSWVTSGRLGEWDAFESSVAAAPDRNLGGWLTDLGLLDEGVADQATALTSDPGGMGVQVPGPLTDRSIQLLAAGHGRGGPKNLVVPFIRAETGGDVG